MSINPASFPAIPDLASLQPRHDLPAGPALLLSPWARRILADIPRGWVGGPGISTKLTPGAFLVAQALTNYRA